MTGKTELIGYATPPVAHCFHAMQDSVDKDLPDNDAEATRALIVASIAMLTSQATRDPQLIDVIKYYFSEDGWSFNRRKRT